MPFLFVPIPSYADANPHHIAAHDRDPATLEVVLQKGNATPETLKRGLDALSELLTTPAKAVKVESILRRTQHRDPLDDLLIKEVQTLLKTPNEKRHLAVLKSLIRTGADVNAYSASALCLAISAASTPIFEVLFATQPTPSSLAACLPHALNIPDPMDRLTFSKRLLDAGVPAAEANRALVHAVNTYTDDISLINALASKAELGDGEALVYAVRLARVELVELLLANASQRYAPDALNTIFAEATRIRDREKRVAICALLLKAGTSGPVVSEALLAASADGDLALGSVLMERGASVEHRDGQAIVEASRAGAVDILSMLLSSPVEVQKSTLDKGFQAATEIGDLGKRAGVFRLLLEKGVSGDVVDQQLVSAARFGEDGKDLVKLLLEFGADVNYNNGEAVWTATRSANMGSLALMLNVVNVGSQQQKPSKATLTKTLKASWRLSRNPRYQVMDWIFAAGLPISQEELQTTLSKAVKDEPDLKLVKLLLSKGASPVANGCQSLIDAATNLQVDVLEELLEYQISIEDLSWTFQQSFTPTTATTWLSEEGYLIAKILIDKGARGDGLGAALGASIEACGRGSEDKDSVARRFVDLLRAHADVNSDNGIILQKATKLADVTLIEEILKRGPDSQSVSMAFPYTFESESTEEDTLRIINIFTNYHVGEARLDVMFAHPELLTPIVFLAASRFPRSVKILQALLDAGYYHDQTVIDWVVADVEEDEEINLLLWALLQPQKRISDGVIELMIQRGANINFETRLSRTTPLMLAVQNKRRELVRSLILAGAEVDVTDITGNTPLSLATQIGGDIGTSMMSNILAAEPSKNDGSLHNAARDLSIRAVQILVDFGHDVDFPSPIHGGRSALAELCLNAAQGGPLTGIQEKQMEKVMACLISQGTDLSLHSNNKSLLLLAMDSGDPVTITRTLLKVSMWKHINEPFNNYNDGAHVYSPTQYVSRVLTKSDKQDALLALLKANRAKDTYYAVTGAQPSDAVNLPEDLQRAELERLARLERAVVESEEHARAVARTQELAHIQEQIISSRAELEAARNRRQRADEISAMRERSVVEDEVFAAEVRRRKVEREDSLRHEMAVTDAAATRVRTVGAAEMELLGDRQQALLDWEKKMGGERVDNAKQMSLMRVREREDLEKFDAANDARIAKRINEQKRLVDSQNSLASKIAAAGASARRQIGYVTGELD
jgi:ankyrin repeat protein